MAGLTELVTTDELSRGFYAPEAAAVRVAQFVATHGAVSRPRGMDALECLWLDFNVMYPEMLPAYIEKRNLNPRYAALEICSLIGGMPTDPWQREIAKGMAAYQDYGIQRGNYGVRVRNQLRDFVWKLAEDRQSRQAVMTIYDGNSDLRDESSDVPCTLSIHGMIRNGQFYMRTTMRSNDVYLGLPYDLQQFCALQATFAQALNVECGFYRHSVGSAHAYVHDVEKIMAMELGEPEHEGDLLWAIPDVFDDPRDRMAHVIKFCQNGLYGTAMMPQTEFEHWLLESL